MKKLIIAIALVAIFAPVVQASPCDTLPETPIYLWRFGCLYSGPDSVPVVQRAFAVSQVADLRWNATYTFLELPTEGEWSRALFYATGKPPKEWNGPVIYCHIRNGKDGKQVLACVTGDGKWSRKPKATMEINPPIVAGQPFLFMLRYATFSGTLVASLQAPLSGVDDAPSAVATLFAQVRVQSDDLRPFDLHRLQLGHPDGNDKIDRPSEVVIRDARLMDRTHQ